MSLSLSQAQDSKDYKIAGRAKIRKKQCGNFWIETEAASPTPMRTSQNEIQHFESSSATRQTKNKEDFFDRRPFPIDRLDIFRFRTYQVALPPQIETR